MKSERNGRRAPLAAPGQNLECRHSFGQTRRDPRVSRFAGPKHGSPAAFPGWASLIAVLFLAGAVSNCGSNATTIGVTVVPTTTATSALSVIEGQTQSFSANVSGGSTTTVYWQICLPATTPTTPPTQPTTCTPIPVTGVTVPGQTPLKGYGTITQNGVYQAPDSIPQTEPFVVMAISTVNFTAFGTAYLQIDSGVRVQVEPASASVGTSQTFAVTAQVTGTTNTAVTWEAGGIAGGDINTVGTIVAGGPACPAPPQTPPAFTQNCATYTAPATTGTSSTTVSATSSADSSQSASATINISQAEDPVITSIDPTMAEQGSVQQDVYLTGTNLYTTSTILVNGTPVPSTWISTAEMRATIPGSLLTQAIASPAGLSIQVERQPLAGQVTGDESSPVLLPVAPMRPVIVASSPDSVQATPSGFGVSLTGGFLSQTATTTTFNGFPGTSTGSTATETFTNSRQIVAGIPAGSLSTPGLYPIVVQNSGLPAGASSTSATNIAVTPPAGSLPTSPVATIPVGSSPSAIAIDQADGYAVVANTGANTVSIISLASNSVVQTVPVGKGPTGVAVDDELSPAIAVVVNSSDNTVSAISLQAPFPVTATVALPALPPPQAGLPAPQAYSIGINPVTHRAIVGITSTNVATILDLSSGTPTVLIAQLGGTNTNYGTGPSPSITVDPRLNWAVVTWGGGGVASGNIVSFVDLGRPANGGDPGSQPTIVATLTVGTSNVQGVGINTETRQVVITTPALGNFTTFSLLDQSVGTVPFTYQGATLNEPGYVAAAASALANIGVAVNQNGNHAAVLDLENDFVIQEITVGNSPVAVAIDSAQNEALVANQADGTVSVLSLGPVRSSSSLGSAQAPQITLSSPEIAYTSATPLSLTVHGGGFASGAQVYLDGTPLTSTVNSAGRQIAAIVPPSMLTSPRHYAVYVQNPNQTVISNVEDLVVIQAISVGSQPYGVAVDTECDLAAVTNYADSTVSVVALTPNPITPGKTTCPSNGSVGTVGTPISVGTNPEGIAVDSHLDMAVVANSASENATVVDLTETNPPATMALSCSGGCTEVNAVGINSDTSVAYVTNVANASSGPVGNLSAIDLPTTGFPSAASGGAGLSNLDATPTGIAVDPYLGVLGISATGTVTGSGSTSTSFPTVDVYNLEQATTDRATGFQLPTGILFDPVNQIFVASNSLPNNIGFIDPVSAIASFVQVGMNPTAVAYNYQTSTLLTANNFSNTMSIISYVCAPSLTPNCSTPFQVRDILPIAGSPQFSLDIDPRLNLAVLADQNNNRILLIPLP